MALGTRIADRLPVGVAAGAQVRQRVVERRDQPTQPVDAGERLRPAVGERMEDRLASLLRRLGHEPVGSQRVEQVPQALHLVGGKLCLKKGGLQRVGDALVRRGAGPEAGRVDRPVGRVERRDQGVAERRHGAPLGIGQQIAGCEQRQDPADRGKDREDRDALGPTPTRWLHQRPSHMAPIRAARWRRL